ncbi:hypothetical protein BU16DRAFT_560399 [Lophium mytilinum]|uniref:Amidase domain-containing protein n=1 Tax=Lophium mytilinum TaxID=390894 RepID=A0A6A6QXV8_9PEZI|nr:hypothetical protein BU16DRAFT_560399 [Lophium mytilinum]
MSSMLWWSTTREIRRRRTHLSRILYPIDFIPENHTEQVDLMEHFLKDVGHSMKCTHRRISIREDWRKSAPVDEKDLTKYLYYGSEHGWYYAAYHSFDEFGRKYNDENGHGPFVTEIFRWYWSLGKEVSTEQHQEIMDHFAVFKAWFNNHYKLNDLQSPFLALHIDTATPRYRDVYPGDTNPAVPGLRPTNLSAILGAPELAIPISQTPYQTRITGKEEQLPMVVGLMGPPSTDKKLIHWTLQALRKSGRATKVMTGPAAFETSSKKRAGL